MATPELSILKLFFPKGVFEWFDAVEGKMDENNIRIIFKEKNLPPLKKEDKNKKILTKGFTDITISDFPIRGRRTQITFKRRYWQIEGQQGYLKRDIQLCFPKTQLEKEFADFLKEDGGRRSSFASFYRQVPAPPGERIRKAI